ncbi:MAG TPA: tetratricopeptide repeat protein [Terriglobales bacterium]|nr:tetratricopeptide repeat protein [Terriglobales bacterium]
MKLSIAIMLAASFVASATAQTKAKAAKPASAKATAKTSNVEVTTTSDAARKAYDEATVLAENLRTSEALEKYRAAVKQDPNLALAWAQIARVTKDPKEEAGARLKAKSLAAKVSPGEALLVKWVVARNDNNSVAAIAAMNDLHALYPTDPHLGFLFGQWLQSQQGNERAAQILEDSIKANPNDAPLYNELGYAYSALGQHDKGIGTMKRYVELLPNEPNPHDSYAELNRLAGHYDEALKHYREALKIMPSFTSSQLGIADTYALMGDQERARAEYDKAVAQESGEREKLDYKFQRAITFIRAKDYAGAEKAFTELSQEADKAGFADLESECHRAIASVLQDRNAALAHMAEAEKALSHPHQTPASVLQQQLSRVLRTQAIIAQAAGKTQLASSSLKRLETMATSNRDAIVQASYHGAKGGVLFAQKKYADAAEELADDADNALSQARLAEAYAQVGKQAEAQAERDRLANQHRVLLEDAIVHL